MGATDTIQATSGTPVEEPRVRDRADVARQARLVITFAISLALLVYFALSIDNTTVTYVLGERVSVDD
jgi:general nucleoside transport system permease protein